MIRKKSRYVKPRKLYIKDRIKEENVLVSKYALKSKTEIWKTAAKINYFRKRAMALAKSSREEQQILFNKLKTIGLKIDTTADVLALKTEDLLERRLPMVVFKKGLAQTPQQARQMIVHKKVLIEDKIVNVPSYIVSLQEESSITVKPAKQKKLVEKKEETVETSNPPEVAQ
ncbi:MAG: 30S ribosomal protein S4 [Nanoarchaeota archaeon]|nr:30S ribosomal protein S4 [Nanoarchaeota archaeon]